MSSSSKKTVTRSDVMNAHKKLLTVTKKMRQVDNKINQSLTMGKPITNLLPKYNKLKKDEEKAYKVYERLIKKYQKA